MTRATTTTRHQHKIGAPLDEGHSLREEVMSWIIESIRY